MLGTVRLAFAVIDAPDKLTDVGDIAQVVFAGPPPQLSDTMPLKPFTGITVTVYVAFLPVAVWDEGDTDKAKSTTCTSAGEEALVLKLASPLKVAMTVRSTAVWNVMAHEPAGAAPVQFSPVLAWTVTMPEGVSILAACGATEKAIVTGLPTSAGLDVMLVITVDVVALTASPWSCTCWVVPLRPPLSSVNVSVPVFEPTVLGANVTLSEQLLPGARGDDRTQFCVDVNCPVTATPLTCKGAVPVLETVTVR
jgi:hypothetical protein